MRRLAGLLVAGALVMAGVACSDDGPGIDRAAGRGEDGGDGGAVERPRGGSVRVGVWSEPDPALDTFGGQLVRSLVWPVLFVARPDGSWAPSIVEPGSVTEAPDGRSAAFRLRSDVVWSDGTPVGVEDLRRTADERFVERVGGPASDGTITVTFTHPLKGWQRLWSGGLAIAPPAEGRFGGPFEVESREPGLETVLKPVSGWWGSGVFGGPYLDEVRLVVVPDPVIAGQLLERGELDVLAPLAATDLEATVARMPDVEQAAASNGGWWFGLLLNGSSLGSEERAGLVAAVERRAFVDVLLRGEARVLDGFGPGALYAESPGPWKDVGVGDAGGLRGDTVDLVGYREVPMSSLLQRSMQRHARDAGGTIELRNADAPIVGDWLATGEYQAALVLELDPPWPCWTCRWGAVSGELGGLAEAADGGDVGAVAQLQERLRAESLVVPIWRPVTRVAWRSVVHGVEPNGYAPGSAWNAWQWWLDRS